MKIDLLSSNAQALGDMNLVLGLDAEVLLRRSLRTIWPHEVTCPQERGDLRWARLGRADWHGDGYAFELCTSPTFCLDGVLYRMADGFNTIRRKLKTSRFDAPVLYTVPEKIAARAPEEVKRLGCAPSFNIYDDPGDPTVLKPTERTTGFHLHISHEKLKRGEATSNSVKWADVLVGNAWNYITPTDRHSEARRRAAYGRAGEHRRNVYPDGAHGFEYRVLPGTVIVNPAYVTVLFSLLRYAVHFGVEGVPPKTLREVSVKAINTADSELSDAVLRKLPFTHDSFAALAELKRNPPRKIRSLAAWASDARARRGHRWFLTNGENY